MKRDTQLARDTWIALRCKLGDPQGFRDLVAELELPLLYYVTKLIGDADLALDVLQGVWTRVFRTVRNLREPAALRTWVYRIARGLALNRVRSETTRQNAEQAAAAVQEVGQDSNPQFDAEDIEALHAALDELDEKHREVLVLHFLEDLSIGEIAEIVGVPAGTVKSRIHYAKRAIERQLKEGNHGSQR
jgi:RNA polymerase sigma-70 factor (ECF subfamily)